MTEPIVSPWLIYLLGQIDAWRELLAVVSILGGTGLLVCSAFTLCTVNDEYAVDAHHVSKKCSLWGAVVVVPMILAALAMPNRDIVIAMCVAKNVTPQAITKTVEAGKNIKDELVNDIIMILNAKQKEEPEE